MCDTQSPAKSTPPRYHWDRCGPLSPQCERFFVQEACFYECEPAAGLFRRYPTDTTIHDREGHIESPRLVSLL